MSLDKSEVRREKLKKVQIKNKNMTDCLEEFTEREVFILKEIFKKLKRKICHDMFKRRKMYKKCHN